MFPPDLQPMARALILAAFASLVVTAVLKLAAGVLIFLRYGPMD